ncbi:hypothetical protein OCI63_001202 [Salmonella enterica]|nr:hypothetical protein [Salmonella enterica]
MAWQNRGIWTSRSACWLLFTLNRWTSAALQMKRPSQSSGGLHYHRSDLLAIDIPAHQVFTPSTNIYSAISLNTVKILRLIIFSLGKFSRNKLGCGNV